MLIQSKPSISSVVRSSIRTTRCAQIRFNYSHSLVTSDIFHTSITKQNFTNRLPTATNAVSLIRKFSSSALSRVTRTPDWGSPTTPTPVNERVDLHPPGSTSRANVSSALDLSGKSYPVTASLYVDNVKLAGSAGRATHVSPGNLNLKLLNYPLCDSSDVNRAIDAALRAKPSWETLPFTDRAAVFLRCAELVATKYRSQMLAATMLGQGKTVYQAEIDCVAELCDFLRFNAKYAEEIYAQQPKLNSPGTWNRLEYRSLEGFVYAISPFNFTAIAGNLVCAPALMGNVIVWKPSPHAMLSNYLLLEILHEAGLPRNVIQMIPGDAQMITRTVLAHRDFSALHFTGSTKVFQQLYSEIGAGVAEGRYRSFPRFVGETGGKNFHLVHSSADVTNAVACTIKSAFEYGGQKCSACSRVYVSSRIWPEFRAGLEQACAAKIPVKTQDGPHEQALLNAGSVTQFENFLGPVIHEESYNRIQTVIKTALEDPSIELIGRGTTSGGLENKYDGVNRGYYIAPHIFMTKDPQHELMKREIFGPVVCIHVYHDNDATPHDTASLEKVCGLIDESTGYALTGSVFANDRFAVQAALTCLRHSAGNMYVNAGSTGAVVGQQAFGGARGSGTNDKAGSAGLLMRFVSARCIKETLVFDLERNNKPFLVPFQSPQTIHTSAITSGIKHEHMK